MLLTDEGQVKLCDFGMAASFGGRGSDCVLQTSHVDLQLTTYVITRWYRAPEVVLAEPYDEKVDVWSVVGGACMYTCMHGACLQGPCGMSHGVQSVNAGSALFVFVRLSG